MDRSAGLPLILALLLPLITAVSGGGPNDATRDGDSPGPQREIKLGPGRMTWDMAQEYCRKYFTDLATLRNESEARNTLPICPRDEACWIGLHRKEPDADVWAWSSGEEMTFSMWKPGQPNNKGHGHEDCVVSVNTQWYDNNCKEKHPFLCSEDNVILVKENKTWEEALHHCRTLKSRPGHDPDLRNPVYDLFVRSGIPSIFNYTKRMVQAEADTQEAWIGFRFLAGQWLWLDGKDVKVLNRDVSCPVNGMNCGALRGGIRVRNCEERRNFVCSKRL